MIDRIRKITIRPDSTLLHALKLMDELEHKLLLVMEENRYIGLLSIGDIQRAIINNINLNEPIGSILRKEDITFGKPEDSTEEIKAMMLQYRTEFMPVVDDQGTLLENCDT